MPLITPPNADSPEYRQDQVRQKVRTVLDEIHRHVRTGYETLNQQFTATRPDGGTPSQLTPDEAYKALGEDRGQFDKMRRALRDFLNAVSPGAGDLPADQHKAAFGEEVGSPIPASATLAGGETVEFEGVKPTRAHRRGEADVK